MTRDPRHDILFEPVHIGPVTTRNRFYQVPHCSGMGFAMPKTLAAMRGIKAEGGWGVVCTEYCSVHPTAEDLPYPYASLWDDEDVRAHAAIADAVHAHGALAGVELAHGGHQNSNRLSREVPLAVSDGAAFFVYPQQPQAMDRSDISNVRRWHVDAAKRAMQAGYDIVYIFVGHGYLPAQFIARRFNHRSDEYGGSLENRVRLTRELLTDIKDAIGHRCAVAIRFAVDEIMGDAGLTSGGEGRDTVALLAELPDLWDVHVGDVPGKDSASSRFEAEGWQEPYVSFVKKLTTKPVVGVGRFTSPDAMASQVRRGVLDLIGAARPSIADPFLPKKIDEGHSDEIRECIGCNICRAANNSGVPIRCTQNPTMGEEWRRGWHPEIVPPSRKATTVLVVGSGPAGLECARVLGKRGLRVMLSEANETLGGRIAREATLPGLAAWRRVADYRLRALEDLANVELFPASRLEVDDVIEAGAQHVVLATGADWCTDGTGYHHRQAVSGWDARPVLTPTDIIDGAPISGPVLIYDDDRYYMAGRVAERLRAAGHAVTIVTPASELGSWSHFTDEQVRTQALLMTMGIAIVTGHALESIGADNVTIACVYTGRTQERAATTLVMVGARRPKNALYRALTTREKDWQTAGIESVTRIGDCRAPGAIADAVFAGHRFAREFGEAAVDWTAYRRERPVL